MLCSTPSPGFIVYRFFFLMTDILTSLRWYLLVVLICISLTFNGVEHLFMCYLPMSSLRKGYLDLPPIFFFFNWAAWAVCVLEINPLSVALFANISFHSKGCLFILFMVHFTIGNLLSFIGTICNFCFYFHYSRRWLQKIMLWSMSKRVLPMFSRVL